MRRIAGKTMGSPGLSALVILGVVVLLMIVKVVGRLPEFGAMDVIAICLPLAMLIAAVYQFARRQWRAGILSIVAIPGLLLIALLVSFVGMGLVHVTRGTRWYSASADLPNGLGGLTLLLSQRPAPVFLACSGKRGRVQSRSPTAPGESRDVGAWRAGGSA